MAQGGPMKSFLILATLLISHFSFATEQTPKTPIEEKQMIFCDYVESENFQLFVDIYVKLNSESDTYSEPEFGVFQGTEQTGYPDYVWSHTTEYTESAGHSFELTNDAGNRLSFSLNGTPEGLHFTKEEGKITEFQLNIKGLVNGDKNIEATFVCYDPKTKDPG